MSKQLKRGDQWTSKDRLWAVVDSNRKLALGGFGSAVAIYRTRAAAKMNCAAGHRIVRLSDVSGHFA